ncbi:tetratricopeptide repeat protein [Streptomyces sp. ICN988]|uniref:ATP-binding protein n=1 Tax=Streptomyces sp. ICN988 TaxID=2983765 RepID=UPI0021E47767|nr:BTAD domain-containing putative transcriptional regulator [Streptomyces sp. ICN988]MCV2462980.1 tetratricopeptide repeat protein [Streptomyces sp. ICN988]
MRFGILGPLDIRTDDGTPVDPGGPRPRALLTLLLLDAGRTVSPARLIDGLYGSEPPAGAANALQSQISRLRGRLAPHVPVEGGSAGYRVVTPAESVDSHIFERLCGEGRAALAAGDHARAATALRAALALWRGPALPDLPRAPAEADRLTELRLTAVQDRVEADLALGGGPELVPELRALLSAHPLSERLYGQLMRALHAGGRPAEALTVYEEARRTLAEQLGADPSPELSALHGELLRGHTAAAPRRPRLPAQLTRCVGRDAELDRITALFAEARLVTLTGPGGTGKTRLAIEAASRCGAPDAPADVCFVELAPLTDGGQIPYAVLTALGVREGFRTPGTDATERLLTALEDRRALLVLDNCEHLVDAAAALTALLLGACPGVRVLATSRESLQITGEALVPVPPLPPRPSAELFLERARAVRPGFDGHARVPEICAALDGLPLAIELAAARLRTLAPDELADRLDDRFRLLSRGDRAKAPRHRTLRAVVEWSWELLDDEERELARRLTVFTGGATLEAVAAVCGVPHPEDLLASLVEKSLLEHLPEGRYRMLETLRAFAAEQLTGRDRLRDAHAAYFLDLAERAEPHLRTGGQLPWLSRLAAERGNLDAAQRHLTETDPREALRLMAALTWFHRLRGLHGEQVPRARALMTAVGDEPPEGLAEEYALCAMNAVSGDGEGDPAEAGRLARVSALMASLDRPLRLPFTVVLHSLTCGPTLVADALPRVQVGKGPWGLALLDMGIGYQELFGGRAAESEAAFARSLAGFRATGDRWGMANCLDPLGGFANRRGAYDRALELLDEGLAHVRELGSPEETADLLRSRALVLLHRGETEEAARHFTHSAALARSVGASDKVASARRGLGDVARLSGDTARARGEYEHALRLCADNWFSTGESVRILVGLGRTAAAEGDARTAADWLEQARLLAVDSPDVLALAEVAESLAVVAPDPERAAELLGAATGLRGAPAPGDPDATRTEREVRARLAPEAYDHAFARGRRLRAAAVSAG